MIQVTPEELHEMRAKIGRSSSAKGGMYERDVAKKICSFFGYNPKEWEFHWLRTKRTKGGQPHGDLKPVGPLAELWYGAGLGPIEAKSRKEWSFMELWKNPEGCKLHKYWQKSNADTHSDNSVVCFTKPYSPDFVFFDASELEDRSSFSMFQSAIINGKTFLIVRLEHFLTYYFPTYGPKD